MKWKMLVLASDKVVSEHKTMPMMILISTVVLPPSPGHSLWISAQLGGLGRLGSETATCSLSPTLHPTRENFLMQKYLLTNICYFNKRTFIREGLEDTFIQLKALSQNPKGFYPRKLSNFRCLLPQALSILRRKEVRTCQNYALKEIFAESNAHLWEWFLKSCLQSDF